MTALTTPRGLDAEIERMLRVLSDLRTEYRWLYYAATQQTVMERNGGTTPGPSDPTGGVVSSEGKARARGDLKATAAEVRESANALASKLKRLEKRLGRAGIPTLPRGPYGPRTATFADLDEAREAQRRRAAAGASFGEG